MKRRIVSTLVCAALGIMASSQALADSDISYIYCESKEGAASIILSSEIEPNYQPEVAIFVAGSTKPNVFKVKTSYRSVAGTPNMDEFTVETADKTVKVVVTSRQSQKELRNGLAKLTAKIDGKDVKMVKLICELER